MFRKFKFEEDLYASLSSIPLSTQFKLDRAGYRLPVKTWNQLSLEERNVLCHLSVRSQGELDCYRNFVEHVFRKLKEKPEKPEPTTLLHERALWENLAQVPEGIYLRALKLKVMLSPEDWLQLDDMERYALFRLAIETASEKVFHAALEEFLGHKTPKVRAAGAS
ncbi:MAG TPA: nitrate reductase associated protein [bacterium]|nr:nitrate reductase associated protein [bacterium]